METQTKENFLSVIQKTPVLQLANLEIVKSKFVQNFNLSHNSNMGEMMYSRQVIFFNQAISGSSGLSKCDPFSLYACFVTAAVKGYSFDPADDEVYLIPRGGKAYLQRQAGAYVKRLKQSNQIVDADQAQLIYRGDIFTVSHGRVVEHSSRFESEEIVAGYVRFQIDAARDKYFIYYRSDWEDWRSKSENPKTIEKQGQYGPYIAPSPWDGGKLNGTQPSPGFLRTKIVLHASKEKCWATGSQPIGVDSFANVIVDDIDHEDIPNDSDIDRPNSASHPNTATDQAETTPSELDF